jgi:L-aminopeptidase/D-esterase-like protein
MANRSRPRAGEAGLRLGSLPPGPLDAIVDVPGVRVGHVSLLAGEAVRTGVTAILSHPGDPFRAETVAGRDGHVRRALPLEPALAILRRYGQLA